MKLLILQEKLKEGLRIVSRAATKSLSLPTLNNILLRTEKNFLSLSATDLEIGINWWSLAKIEREGKITLPAQFFLNFIESLPNKKVSLEKTDLALNIECENYKTQLKGYHSDDFPIIPKITEGESFSLNTELFCQGLNQVVGIASPSTTRPEISGIYFTFEKGRIKMVATDSFRLGEKTIPIEELAELKQEYSLILPQKTAKEVVNIFSETKGKINIHLTANQILFEKMMSETPQPEIQLISRLIEGEYPNYEEIIPKKSETKLAFSKKELVNQLKTASLFSGKINEVKVKVDPKKDRIEIFSQAPDLGEYSSFFPAKIEGRAAEISFNHRFLIDGLLNIKSSEVLFELNGEGGPAMLRPVDDETYLYVVMPIKAS